MVTGPFLISSERASRPGVVEFARVGIIPRASCYRVLASQRQTEMVSRASAAGLGCVRGTSLALGFEAATALVIYAMWHILRLFH
jgi:hypothetical protein